MFHSLHRPLAAIGFALGVLSVIPALDQLQARPADKQPGQVQANPPPKPNPPPPKPNPQPNVGGNPTGLPKGVKILPNSLGNVGYNPNPSLNNNQFNQFPNNTWNTNAFGFNAWNTNSFGFNSNSFGFNSNPFAFNNNAFAFNNNPLANPFMSNAAWNKYALSVSNPNTNAFAFNNNPFAFNNNPFAFNNNPFAFNNNPFAFNNNLNNLVALPGPNQIGPGLNPWNAINQPLNKGMAVMGPAWNNGFNNMPINGFNNFPMNGFNNLPGGVFMNGVGPQGIKMGFHGGSGL